MQVIQANQVRQAVLVQWVILVHQVQHFQVKEEKRVFLVQSVRIYNLLLNHFIDVVLFLKQVFQAHKVLQVKKVNQVCISV